MPSDRQRRVHARLRPSCLSVDLPQDPLLIHGRKFGVRVWVLVSGHSPLRAYLHGNGLVLFADHE